MEVLRIEEGIEGLWSSFSIISVRKRVFKKDLVLIVLRCKVDFI